MHHSANSVTPSMAFAPSWFSCGGTTTFLACKPSSRSSIVGLHLTENNTAAYISDVATRMNVPADQPLMICPETYITFAQAITVHENGVPPIIYPVYWYSPEVYQQAYNLTVPSGVQAS